MGSRNRNEHGRDRRPEEHAVEDAHQHERADQHDPAVEQADDARGGRLTVEDGVGGDARDVLAGGAAGDRRDGRAEQALDQGRPGLEDDPLAERSEQDPLEPADRRARDHETDLVGAIGADIVDKIAAATDRARLDDGTAPEALRRLCQEYFELGDSLQLVFENPRVMNWQGWEEESASDRALLRLLERGHAEGTIDPGSSAAWLQQVLWSLLYAAWSFARWEQASKHEALNLCLRTLERSIAVRDQQDG